MTRRFQIYDMSDCFGYCPPGQLQKLMQTVASDHAADIGFSRETLPGGAVWVVSKSRFRLDRPIHRMADVDITTWYRGAVGAQLYRDFDVFQDGERVGEAVTAWLMYDRDRGRILRPSEVNQDYAIYTPPEPKTYLFPKLTAPAELTDVGAYTVRYSDLDINRHMNNARYVDLACDAVELWRHADGFVRDVAVYFHKQALPGESIRLLRGQTGSGADYVAGLDADGQRKFEAVMEIG